MQAQENHADALSKTGTSLAASAVTLATTMEGRRGMDAEGYCVVVVIPFETPYDAITIQVNVFELLCLQTCVPMARS